MIEKLVVSPFQKFIKIGSLSGILLFIATMFALIWANSAFSETYHQVWDYKIGETSKIMG